MKVGSVAVKIYRNAHASNRSGWTYVVAWHTPTGRKRAKFADEAEAVKEADLRATQIANGRIEASSITREDRDEIATARKLVGKTPLLSALREWCKAHELTHGQVIAAAEAWRSRNRSEISAVTVSDLITMFMREKKKLGYATADNHGSIFESVRSELGAHNVGAVTAAMLSAYLGKIAHPVTRNTHRKRIVTLWRWAQSKNHLPRDTRTEAEQTDRAREVAPPVGIITAPVFGKLLEFIRANTPDDLPALVLAGFCGMRRGEVHEQKWEDVDLVRKFVRVSYAKKGTPARRLVPLSDSAVNWLMLCPKRRGAVSDGLAIDRIRKLGIEKKFELPDNCLRHGYISHHVAAIGNVPQAALDSGNSVQIIHRHYRELVTPDEGRAWFGIEPMDSSEHGARVIAMSGEAVARE